MEQSVSEKIQQRRLQILVHSYLYYELDNSIVSDATWTKWAKELVQLQKENPNIANEVKYSKEFADFDGSTGAFFKYDDFIINRANKLLQLKKELTTVKEVIKKQPTVMKLF